MPSLLAIRSIFLRELTESHRETFLHLMYVERGYLTVKISNFLEAYMSPEVFDSLADPETTRKHNRFR